MKVKDFWGTSRSSGRNVGMIVRIGLAMFAIVGSIALAFFLLGGHEGAHATPPPGVNEKGTTGTTPWGVFIDSHGNTWVAEPGCQPAPPTGVCGGTATGTIDEFAVSTASGTPTLSLVNSFAPPTGTTANPTFLVVDGSGNVWFTDPTNNAIGELIPGATPPTTATWKTYKSGISANAAPYDLVLDKHGNLWFTELAADKIGVFNTTVTPLKAVETAVPTASSQPLGITYNSNTNTVWFAENAASNIGSFSAASTTITIKEHAISTATTGAPNPHLITVDASGNIWFSEGSSGQVGEFVPASSTTTQFAACATPTSGTCTGSFIGGIAVDSTGLVWFTDSLNAAVGSIKIGTGGKGTVSEFVLNKNAHPQDGLAVDASNNVWFSEEFGNRVGEIQAGTKPPAPTTLTVNPTSLSPSNCTLSGSAYTCTVALSESATGPTNVTWTPSSSLTGVTFNPANGSLTPGGTATNVTISAISSTCTAGTFTFTGSNGAGSATVAWSCTATTPTPTPPPTSSAPVSKSWYFAEGKVGGGFTEWLTIENPDPTNDCNVNIQYLLPSGNPVTKSYVANHASRFTTLVNNDLAIPASSTSPVTNSTIVTTTNTNCNGVVAERPMYVSNFPLTSGTVSSGSDVIGFTNKVGKTFYFADVPTGANDASFITILAPSTNTAAANVTATFYSGGQALPNPATTTVAAGTRGTILLTNTGTVQHAAVAITSSQPIMVERPNYFSNISAGNAGTVSGASSVVGVQTQSNDWLFAEGTVRMGFQENLVLANFSSTDITGGSLLLEYDNGVTLSFPVSVKHLDQTVFDINAMTANPANFPGNSCVTTPSCTPSGNVSIEVKTPAGTSVVAQREMFFHYTHYVNGKFLTATGGTDVIGQPGPAAVTAYSFAEGYTNTDYNEFLTLQNPTANAETITVSLVNGDGNNFTEPVNVPAHSRATVDITALVAQHLIHAGDTYLGYEVSMVVTSSSPFVAERPLYWDTGATTGGTDVLGFAG